LITPQDVVGEGSQPGEGAWLLTDAGLILLEGDIASLVQPILDVPMASNCDSGVAR
jgi:hypothetical protein